MRSVPHVLHAIATRFVPALVTALGVVIITAGLLSYADPATAGAMPTPTTVADVVTPSPDATATTAPPSASPSDDPGASPSESTAPSGSPSTAPVRAVVTRVVVPSLQIDLPVVEAPKGYPYCNVAMYYSAPLSQPGEGKATYIFAHARDGMFGPIYNLAMVQNTPRKMIGMIVQVYTSDNKLYLYEVTQVKLHQLTLDAPIAATTEQLWLQTSEGPKGTPGKTQLLAMPLSVGAADPADAHPKARPVVCG